MFLKNNIIFEEHVIHTYKLIKIAKQNLQK